MAETHTTPLPTPEDGDRGRAAQAEAELQQALSDKSPTDQLLHLANLYTEELFPDRRGRGYAVVRRGGHRETHRIKSDGFQRWLSQLAVWGLQKTPSEAAFKMATRQLDAIASAGDARDTYVRVAPHEGRIYLDLCDAAWRVVEVTQDGWRVMPEGEDPPVHFVRSPTAQPLPVPEQADLRGVTWDDLPAWRLFDWVNVTDEGDQLLVFAWLIGTLMPQAGAEYPILLLRGVQGSAKSRATELVRSVVDPRSPAHASLPRKEDDLLIAAGGGLVAAFDNLSSVSADMSDSLCRLSTGAGFTKRTLYSDDEETTFDLRRPVVMNGIGSVSARGDLLHRAIVIDLPVLDDYVPSDDVLRGFGDAHPAILGNLLDWVVLGLRRMWKGDMGDGPWPRMAAWAQWAAACDPTVLAEGRRPILDLYRENVDRSNAEQAGESYLAEAVADLVRGSGGHWRGRPSQLLGAIELAIYDRPDRPRDARELGNELRVQVSALRSLGVGFERVQGNESEGWKGQLVYVLTLDEKG